MGTLTMNTILRRVDSFRMLRKDDSASLKILTSPRRKSLEASFLFPTTQSPIDDEMIRFTDVYTDVATDQFSHSKDENVHLNNLKTASREWENIKDLLKQQRFRPQLDFERKFLREYSRRLRREAPALSAVFVKERENELSDDLKKSTTYISDNVFPCPQFEYSVGRHLNREHIPAYCLTCAYKFASKKKLLNIVIRQTGTLPEIKNSKLSCSVAIDGQKEKQRLVLAKSENDKSFKSHEIVFNEQAIFDLQRKMLSVKLYVHSKPFTKKRVAEWRFGLANVCDREKIECKRFMLNL